LENKKFNHAEKGQSLVELALTLLIILTLLAGAVDLGMAFFSFVALRDAAQEGALYGSVAPIIDTNLNRRYDTGEPLNTVLIVSRVRSSSSTPVDLSDISKVTVSVTTSTTPCAGGSITVSVTYNYPLTMPLIGAIIGSPTIRLPASVTDTILSPSCPP